MLAERHDVQIDHGIVIDENEIDIQVVEFLHELPCSSGVVGRNDEYFTSKREKGRKYMSIPLLRRYEAISKLVIIRFMRVAETEMERYSFITVEKAELIESPDIVFDGWMHIE
jgi:hypothetical protein